ncbi:MAG: TauD/TfdA family dioxygenase [Flavobacteriaceae bacterium]
MINYFDLENKNLRLSEISKIALKAIFNEGYIIFRNFPFDLDDLDKTKKVFIELCELIGTPISHDQKNSIVWDIKKAHRSSSQIKTYSEHSHEAALHTDSQYSYYPEDMFGLLTLVKANCGGGSSYLLSLKDIFLRLNALQDGQEIIRILSSTDFPFIVPNVFKKDDSKKHEFNFGPILRNNVIRFRIDTFEKALLHDHSMCSQEQLIAYQKLKTIVTNKSLITELFLEAGDLIFINNKTMLHGRSKFEDKNRHLMRIRMNKKENCHSN